MLGVLGTEEMVFLPVGNAAGSGSGLPATYSILLATVAHCRSDLHFMTTVFFFFLDYKMFWGHAQAHLFAYCLSASPLPPQC